MLPECLEALRGVADEICVVDTGSEDGTFAIAERFGCRMARVAWRNDFAAARNASLELCTGAWIFVVDADERIAPEDRPALRALAEHSAPFGYRMTTRNYSDATYLSDFNVCMPGDANARGFAGWFPSVKVRLFPNVAGARFEGHVHELVNNSLEANGIALRDAPVPVHHYPLLKPVEAVRRKQELYIALGIKKTELTPDDPKVWSELGTQYNETGEHLRAVQAFKEAVRRDPGDPVLLRNLGGALYLMGRPVEACACFEACLKIDPNQFDAWRNLGVASANRAEWEQALACFERAAAINDAHPDIHRYRGVALARLNRPEEAAQAARAALERQPQNPESRALYEEQMERIGKGEEARAVLSALGTG